MNRDIDENKRQGHEGASGVDAPADRLATAPSGSGRGDLVWLIALLVVYLEPIWVFPFLPTQDGPSHVANAAILLNYGRPGSRYAEFYELRREPIPNWTSHIVLAGLLLVVPPLIAERLLVSALVVAFVAGFRYYLGAFGPGVRRLWPLGLLLVYNRSLLMGFYNFYLATALFWIILGYTIRRRDAIGRRECLCLCGLFLIQYFSHLVGLLLSVPAAAWFLLWAPGKGRARKLGWLTLAALPSLCLTAYYLLSSGFFGPKGALWVNSARPLLNDWNNIVELILWELTALNENLFGAYEISWLPIGILSAFFIEVVLVASWLAKPNPGDVEYRPLRRAALAIALAFAAVYLVAPEHLGEHGGYLRTRLVPFVIMAFAPCVRLPSSRFGLASIKVGMSALLAINLVSVCLFFDAAGRDLVEFTGALNSPELEGNLTMASARGRDPKIPVDYLHHALEFYCIRGGNISLQNYEAGTKHFPVIYRPEFTRSLNGLTEDHWRAADVILTWGSTNDPSTSLKGNYQEVFHQGRLRVMRRSAANTPDDQMIRGKPE